MKKRNSYFAYKRAKATDIRIPPIAKKKSMRGLLFTYRPIIDTTNADTLAADWPFFDEHDPENTYDPLYVDAVVSNPPYSANWDPENKELDPRFADYGLAPTISGNLYF